MKTNMMFYDFKSLNDKYNISDFSGSLTGLFLPFGEFHHLIELLGSFDGRKNSKLFIRKSSVDYIKLNSILKSMPLINFELHVKSSLSCLDIHELLKQNGNPSSICVVDYELLRDEDTLDSLKKICKETKGTLFLYSYVIDKEYPVVDHVKWRESTERYLKNKGIKGFEFFTMKNDSYVIDLYSGSGKR